MLAASFCLWQFERVENKLVGLRGPALRKKNGHFIRLEHSARKTAVNLSTWFTSRPCYEHHFILQDFDCWPSPILSLTDQKFPNRT